MRLQFYQHIASPLENYAGHVMVKARIGMPHESSEDVMDCRCEKTWQRQAATAYPQRYKIESLLRNLAGRNEKYSWDSRLDNSDRIWQHGAESEREREREREQKIKTFFKSCPMFLLVRLVRSCTQLRNGALASPVLHRAFWKSNSKSSVTTSETEGGEGRTRSAE